MCKVQVSLVSMPDYETPIEGLTKYCTDNNLSEPVYTVVEDDGKKVSVSLSIPGTKFVTVSRTGFDKFHAEYKAAQRFIIMNNLPITVIFGDKKNRIIAVF